MKGQPLVEPVNIRQISSHSFNVKGCDVGVSAGEDQGGVSGVQKRRNTLRHLLAVGTGTGVGASTEARAGGERKSRNIVRNLLATLSSSIW